MSEVDSHFVKRGLWTNLDQGQVMGKTITTDSTTGTIVVAVMAIMSTVETSHLWSLLVFGYHQIRATGRPADGLFRQQQTLLRTLPPPSSLMADSVRLWWLWRRRNTRALLRSLPQFLLATLCTVGFIAAGITSSFVVSNSDLEVLVQSPHCGHLNLSMPANALRAEIANIRAVSSDYVQDCYQDIKLLPTRCRAFVRPRINYTTQRSTCPFEANFCTEAGSKGSPAVTIDSGLQDLNYGFGLNLHAKDRVSYRRRTVCTVVPTEGHTTIINASDFPAELRSRKMFPGEEYMLFHFGNRTAYGSRHNVSEYASLLGANISKTYTARAEIYSPLQEIAGMGNSYYPLAGLRREDADVVMIYLANSVTYLNPVNDPWFSAHKALEVVDVSTIENRTVYEADSPFSAMGCTIQHQFCVKMGPGQHCSTPGGVPTELNLEDWKGASPVQIAALQLVVEANRVMPITQAIDLRASRFMLSDGVVALQIPSDQWIKEVEGFDSFVWASLQTLISDYAIGSSIRTTDLEDYVIKPTTPGDEELCGSQKMRKSGGFVNINVFGMAFVIATSLFFAILDISLLKFLIFLDSFKKVLSPRIDRWIQDGVWQLQRRANEAHGEGTWSRLTSDVPLTEPGEILAELPLQSVALLQPTTPIKSSGSHSSSSGTPPLPQVPQVAPTASTESLSSQPSSNYSQANQSQAGANQSQAGTNQSQANQGQPHPSRSDQTQFDQSQTGQTHTTQANSN